jgi:hypothetical protein
VTRYTEKVALSRQRKIKLTKSKAIVLATAGALSVAAAATAATSSGPAPAAASAAAGGLGAGRPGARQLTATDQLMRLTTGTRAKQNLSAALRADVVRDIAPAHLTAQQAQLRAAQQAAAARAAKAAAARAAAAAQPASSASSSASVVTADVSSGSPEQIAQAMLGSFGWSGSQFSCLEPLWAQESGWSVTAYNAGTGAYGIPQALPGSRMASAGADWQTDAATQIKWGLEYIQSTYGSPCAAWAHEEATGWY